MNSKQEEVVRRCRDGESVAVFGEAGTGKTFLRDKVAALGPSIILGPTGASVAGKSGAMTIARFMGATPKTVDNPNALALSMQPPPGISVMRIIVDEVSMVPADVFAALNAALQRVLSSNKPFGGLRVALFGDIFQLRPPTKAGFFFETAVFEDLLREGLAVVSLNKQMRQDSTAARSNEFRRLLTAARRGKLDGASELLLNELNSAAQSPTALHLYAKCSAAAAHNERALKAHPGSLVTVGRSKFKLHAPVVATRNRYERGRLVYANGDSGIVVGFHTSAVAVIIRGGRHVVRALNGVVPLALGWATTVHKAQGRTCDSVVVHGDGIFDAGQAYVAISRVRKLAHLALRDVHADDFEIQFPKPLTDFAAQHNIS